VHATASAGTSSCLQHAERLLPEDQLIARTNHWQTAVRFEYDHLFLAVVSNLYSSMHHQNVKFNIFPVRIEPFQQGY
jgi:hypothetical protein